MYYFKGGALPILIPFSNVMNHGEFLKAIMDEHGLTQRQLASYLKVSQPYLSNILRMKRGISPEMDYRLAKALGSTPQTWMNLQTNWLLSQVDQKIAKLRGFGNFFYKFMTRKKIVSIPVGR